MIKIILASTVLNFTAILNFRNYARMNNIITIEWSEFRMIPPIWAIIYVPISVIYDKDYKKYCKIFHN